MTPEARKERDEKIKPHLKKVVELILEGGDYIGNEYDAYQLVGAHLEQRGIEPGEEYTIDGEDLTALPKDTLITWCDKAPMGYYIQTVDHLVEQIMTGEIQLFIS